MRKYEGEVMIKILLTFDGIESVRITEQETDRYAMEQLIKEKEQGV